MSPNLTITDQKDSEPRRRDASLLAKARTGDKEALGELYEETYPEVWRTVRALIRDEEDCLDVLQDTYLKAFTRLDQLKDAAALRPWLRQTAANTARDHLRRKKPTLFSELLNEDADGDDTPFDLPDDRTESMPELHLDRQETQRLVDEMLRTLSDEQRLAVGMYYYQELPVKTIAEQLGVSQNTVKSQLRYARQKIEKRVRELEKQGVKLYGAAPMVFFRTLLRQGAGGRVPKAVGNLTKQISGKGTTALQSASGTPIKAVTARAMAARRIGAAALAVGVVGSAAAGILLYRNAHPRYGDDRPTVPVDSEHAFVEQFADNGWKDGFLGFLAGTAKTEKDAHPDDETYWAVDSVPPLGTPGFVSEDQSVWYLADVDHDDVPELCMPIQAEGGTLDSGGGLTAFSWKNDQIVSGFVELPDSVYPPYSEEGLRSASLYCDETTQICYTAGPLTVSVEEDMQTMQYPFDLKLRDPMDKPSDGFLSTAEPGGYEAACAYYILRDDSQDRETILGRFTLTQSGETYYLLNRDYITEEKYLETERQWLDKAVWRSFDGTGAAHLQSIPGGDYVGPMSVSELVELLGGYDDRPEWARAKAWLEQPATYATRYASIVQDADALVAALRAQYPGEKLGAGTWQFAAWVSETDGPGRRLWVLYRQTPEEGGSCFLAAETGDRATEGFDLAFDRFSQGEEITFFYDTNWYENLDDTLWKETYCNDVSVLHTVQTDVGPCSALYYRDTWEIPDAEEPLRQIRFVSAEELTAVLAEDPAEITQGLGDPVTVEALLQPDPSVG